MAEVAMSLQSLRRSTAVLRSFAYQPAAKRSVRLLHSKRSENEKHDVSRRINPRPANTVRPPGAARSGISAQNFQSKDSSKCENPLQGKPRWEAHRHHLQKFGKVNELQRRLRLVDDEHSLQRPTVFVSIDTETERLGLLDYVSEVGISVLDTRELENTQPGRDGADWFSKIQTNHWRVDHNNLVIKKHVRGDHCLFCKSENLAPKQVQSALLHHLHSISSTGTEPVDLVLVGHTIDHDIRALNGRPIFLKLSRSINFAQVFDTIALAAEAESQGVTFDSRSLGVLLPTLGVDLKYCRSADGLTMLRGWHNSGNDATYTMMLLVQFALKWKDLTEGNLSTPKSLTFTTRATGERMSRA